MGLKKGSSEERIMHDHNTERHVIRTRGDRTLRAQPRRFLAQPVVFDGKYNGEDIRRIRAVHGVGRPVKAPA
jgi:hypothetical protein